MKPRAFFTIPVLISLLAGLVAPGARAQFGNFPRPGGGPPPLGDPARVMQGSMFPCAVTFTLWRGVIMVTCMVGDGVPIPAALDTGLPMSFLTPQFAAKRGMKPSGSREIDVLDHKMTVTNAPAQNVRMERMALSSIPFVIGDLMGQFSNKPSPDAPPVWLGASALEGLCVTIDPEKGQLVFRAPNSNIPGKVTRVPFTLRDGRIWVEVTANGKEKFDALLNTGSVATLLPSKVATKLELKPDTTLEMIDRNGKPGKVGVAKLATLDLGKLSSKDVPVVYVMEGDPQGVSQDFAVLGNDFLFHHRVTIDFGRKEVAFEVLQPEKPKKEEKKDSKKERPPKSDPKKDSKKDVKKDAAKDAGTGDVKGKDDVTKQGDKPPPICPPPPNSDPPA